MTRVVVRFLDANGTEYDVPEAPDLHTETGVADLRVGSAIHRHVLMVLEYTNGDLAWAAEELGVDSSTLYRLRRAWAAGQEAVTHVVRHVMTPATVPAPPLRLAPAGRERQRRRAAVEI